MSAARGYWVDAPGRGSLRDVELPDETAGTVTLRATLSGVSPGTERLVGLGRVPASCHQTMACRGMLGSFALPVLYGYSFVGHVERGEHAGRRAFVMRPHQTRAVVDQHELRWLPDDVPDARATLFPNLETACNAAWDAAPASGDRVVVVGAGAVGLLVSFALSREHDGEVVVVDSSPQRVAFAQQLPWVQRACAPADVAEGTFAHAIHSTTSSAGLQLAIDAVGFEGVVTELSWYGEDAVTVQLGGSFHHQRKRIQASQVASVAPSHRQAGYGARAERVLQWLADERLDALHGDAIPFDGLPQAMADVYAGTARDVCPVVRYG